MWGSATTVDEEEEKQCGKRHPQTGVEKWSELQEWFEEITMGQEGV